MYTVKALCYIRSIVSSHSVLLLGHRGWSLTFRLASSI